MIKSRYIIMCKHNSVPVVKTALLVKAFALFNHTAFAITNAPYMSF